MGVSNARTVARTIEALKLTYANAETVRAAVIKGYNEEDGPGMWTVLFYDLEYASVSRIAVFPAVVAICDSEQDADEFITAVFDEF